MSKPRAFIIDAFSHGSLRGNAAAVVVLEEERDSAWMQATAAEFNLSETAFLLATGGGAEHWTLRWFTPTMEIDLCGHATLASAHVLWHQLNLNTDLLRFATRSGELLARRGQTPAGDAGIALDFPRCNLSAVSLETLPLHELQLEAVDARVAGEDLLLVLPDAKAIRAYRPDFALIAALPWRGLIITAAHPSTEIACASRFFAPKIGVPEDPVTGAIHCALAPYWSAQSGKPSLLAEQWSERGGRLFLTLAGERVSLLGEARTFLQGELH